MAGPMLLAGLPDEVRRSFLAQARRRRFARREVLFHEGDPADSVHLIDCGRVAVRITGARGESVILDVLGAGQAVGELALLPPAAPRSASAVALERTETLALPGTMFTELRRAHPETVDVLVAMLAERNRRMNRLLLEALHLPADRRVVSRLADICAEDGEVNLTQDDLASLAGTTRETVNRVLRRLQDDGLVTLQRGSLTVHDHAGLARRAR